MITLTVRKLFGILIALGSANSLGAQTAALRGSVVADSSNRPLRDAEVTLSDLKLTVRTDSLGQFALEHLPEGKHSITVRLVGFEPIFSDMTFAQNQRVEIDFVLKRSAQKLGKVAIRDTAVSHNPALADFDRRRKSGAGRFMTAKDFEAQDGRPPSSFLRSKLPGLTIVQSGGRHWLASGRAQGCGMVFQKCSPDKPSEQRTLEKIPPACYLKVIVNGRIEFDGDMNTQDMFDVDKLNAKDIIGLEYYTAATMPAEYNGTSGKYGTCGAVIIWTKAG